MERFGEGWINLLKPFKMVCSDPTIPTSPVTGQPVPMKRSLGFLRFNCKVIGKPFLETMSQNAKETAFQCGFFCYPPLNCRNKAEELSGMCMAYKKFCVLSLKELRG